MIHSCVSILIPTYNRCQILSRTLESLSQIVVPQDAQVELVVIANACTDQTEQVVAKWVDHLPMPTRCVVENEPGLNIARNRAIQEASSDLLAFLDDDVWVDPNWLVALLDGFERYKADVIGGRVLLWWEAVAKPPWFDHRLAGLLSENDRGTEVKRLGSSLGVIGANFAFRREIVNRIGPFKPGLDRTGSTLLAGGDSEFVMRAYQAGFNVVYLPDALVKHWVAPHRITEKYILGVATGSGISQILMKPRQSFWSIARTTLGRLYLLGFHGLLSGTARIRGCPSVALYHATNRQLGWGGLKGLWFRYIKRMRP